MEALLDDSLLRIKNHEQVVPLPHLNFPSLCDLYPNIEARKAPIASGPKHYVRI